MLQKLKEKAPLVLEQAICCILKVKNTFSFQQLYTAWKTAYLTDKYCKAYKESTWSVTVPSRREIQVKKITLPKNQERKKELKNNQISCRFTTGKNVRVTFYSLPLENLTDNQHQCLEILLNCQSISEGFTGHPTRALPPAEIDLPGGGAAAAAAEAQLDHRIVTL